MISIRLIGAVLALPLCFAALTLRAADPRAEDLSVASRDGTELGTSVYLPAEGAGPFACVLSRTPYNKNGLKGVAMEFTKRGYAFVAQDCRGKHKSRGEYKPFLDDGRDGFDTVEWVAKQSWSNGRVGMFGASALGIT